MSDDAQYSQFSSPVFHILTVATVIGNMGESLNLSSGLEEHGIKDETYLTAPDHEEVRIVDETGGVSDHPCHEDISQTVRSV